MNHCTECGQALTCACGRDAQVFTIFGVKYVRCSEHAQALYEHMAEQRVFSPIVWDEEEDS